MKTDFPVSWEELPYIWSELDSSKDANIRAYVDPLPNGSGQVIAAEIISSGEGYVFTPSLEIVSIEGIGGELRSSLRNGKLNILEYVVTGVTSISGGTNNEFTVTPTIAGTGIFGVSTNRIVKSPDINDLVS